MPRMNQAMPTTEEGWIPISAGPHLTVLYHPDRRLGGRVDNITRPSIVVGVPGKDHQILRLDAFSERGHYHVLPTQDDVPVPFAVKERQPYFAPALAMFDEPEDLRVHLVEAGEIEASIEVTDEDLRGVARQIRQIRAAAGA